MLKKCPIIKYCTFANTGFVTGLLSKFKQFTSFDLNYRQISLDFSQNYKEQGKKQTRCTWQRFQKSLASPPTQERRRERIEQLLFKQNRLNDWDRNFLNSIQYEKKLSPKQLERIENQLLGGVQP